MKEGWTEGDEKWAGGDQGVEGRSIAERKMAGIYEGRKEGRKT